MSYKKIYVSNNMRHLVYGCLINNNYSGVLVIFELLRNLMTYIIGFLIHKKKYTCASDWPTRVIVLHDC